MLRKMMAIVALLVLVVACTEPTDPNQRKIFWISQKNAVKIQQRHLEAVNALREAEGLVALEPSKQLIAAAKTHAIDIAKQNRPWHFGSDGSSPIDRVARTGYTGAFVSENIAETYENDMEILQAWMRDPVTRKGIMMPEARKIGLAWQQEPNGKIWWVQVLGS